MVGKVAQSRQSRTQSHSKARSMPVPRPRVVSRSKALIVTAGSGLLLAVGVVGVGHAAPAPLSLIVSQVPGQQLEVVPPAPVGAADLPVGSAPTYGAQVPAPTVQGEPSSDQPLRPEPMPTSITIMRNGG